MFKYRLQAAKHEIASWHCIRHTGQRGRKQQLRNGFTIDAGIVGSLAYHSMRETMHECGDVEKHSRTLGIVPDCLKDCLVGVSWRVRDLDLVGQKPFFGREDGAIVEEGFCPPSSVMMAGLDFCR